MKKSLRSGCVEIEYIIIIILAVISLSIAFYRTLGNKSQVVIDDQQLGFAKPLGSIGDNVIVKVLDVKLIEGSYYVFLQNIENGRPVKIPRMYSVTTNETVICLMTGGIYKTKIMDADIGDGKIKSRIFISPLQD